MTTETTELDAMLRRLHMPTVRRLWRDLETKAETESMRYADYLRTLVEEEVAHRAQTRVSRMTHRARFPFLRTIEEFDFSYQTGLRKELLGSYLGPEFVHEGVNGHLFSPTDVEGCANAILSCLEHRDAMREPARESALPFSVERCTHRLERVYERLVTA